MKRHTPLLSIIVPCYNCESTLVEAIDSIFLQKWKFSFEVITIDDGSTDGTKNLLVTLKKKYSLIKTITHRTNKGGGAARNSGIRASRGQLIFCLDSDNVLVSRSIGEMVTFLLTGGEDGVAFYERKYFLGTNKYIASSHFNPLGKIITLEDLFNDSHVVLDNFLYTRKAFEVAGGYPCDHDFDTQGFEVRFLSKGLRIGICPETIIFHRQRTEQLSYFERVYEHGEYSKNMYLIYEEMFHLFSEKIKEYIIGFNVFSQNDLENNIVVALSKKYQDDPSSFFIPKKVKYMSTEGSLRYCQQNRKSLRCGDVWCMAICDFKYGKYELSLNKYISLMKEHKNPPLLYWNIFRAVTGIEQRKHPENIERTVEKHLELLHLTKRRSILRQSLAGLLVNKILRLFSRRKIYDYS